MFRQKLSAYKVTALMLELFGYTMFVLTVYESFDWIEDSLFPVTDS